MDPYDVLKVARGCSDTDLRRAYRARVRETHPDSTKRDSAAEFLQVTEAFEAIVREREGLSQEEPLPAWANFVVDAVREERDALFGRLGLAAAAAGAGDFRVAGAAAGEAVDQLKGYYTGGREIVRGVRGLCRWVTGKKKR